MQSVSVRVRTLDIKVTVPVLITNGSVGIQSSSKCYKARPAIIPLSIGTAHRRMLLSYMRFCPFLRKFGVGRRYEGLSNGTIDL